MRYVFTCEKCGFSETFILPVDKRDLYTLCFAQVNEADCLGYMKRNFGATVKTLVITSPKFFCESTASDFLPTRDEAIAADKQSETMAENISKSRGGNVFEKARKGDRGFYEQVAQTRRELEIRERREALGEIPKTDPTPALPSSLPAL